MPYCKNGRQGSVPPNSRVSGLRSILSPHRWLESIFLLNFRNSVRFERGRTNPIVRLVLRRVAAVHEEDQRGAGSENSNRLGCYLYRSGLPTAKNRHTPQDRDHANSQCQSHPESPYHLGIFGHQGPEHQRGKPQSERDCPAEQQDKTNAVARSSWGLMKLHGHVRHLTSGRSATGPLTGWLEAPGSMPNCIMDRMEGAVPGQLQRRWAISSQPSSACRMVSRFTGPRASGQGLDIFVTKYFQVAGEQSQPFNGERRPAA